MASDVHLFKSLDSAPDKRDEEMRHSPKKNIQCRYPLRCLVVDDDKVILKIVAHMLTIMGFKKVDIAINKSELVNRLSTSSYDLLVTDLMMPDMNGYDLAQMIKIKMNDIKVIIMTGRHRDDCIEMMAAQWVDGWLFKPFGSTELYSMIKWTGILRRFEHC